MWNEIYQHIRYNASRTVLTCIGISWGIFILIILVGIGEGLEKGVSKLFSSFSKSTTYVYANQTSKGFQGKQIGSDISFSTDIMNYIKRNVPNINNISPFVSKNDIVISCNGKGYFNIHGVNHTFFNIKSFKIGNGRLLNHLDIYNKRKVVLIGKAVSETLFNHTNPVGKELKIGRDYYKVVGVIYNDLFNTSEERNIYMPYSTYTLYDGKSYEYKIMVYNLNVDNKSEVTNKRVRFFLSRKIGFASDDADAVFFSSMEEQVSSFNSFFITLRKFMWFMGLSTLLSGIIGVSNTMYTSTRDRTHEIGIRKSLGASPTHIKTMIISESVAITLLSGIIGIFVGWIFLYIMGVVFFDDSLNVMDKPSISLLNSFVAMFILAFCGCIAGMKPALYASKIKPIDALREEN